MEKIVRRYGCTFLEQRKSGKKVKVIWQKGRKSAKFMRNLMNEPKPFVEAQ